MMVLMAKPEPGVDAEGGVDLVVQVGLEQPGGVDETQHDQRRFDDGPEGERGLPQLDDREGEQPLDRPDQAQHVQEQPDGGDDGGVTQKGSEGADQVQGRVVRCREPRGPALQGVAQHVVDQGEQQQGPGRGPDLDQDHPAEFPEPEAPQQGEDEGKADQGVVKLVEHPHVALIGAVRQLRQKRQERPLFQHQQDKDAHHRHRDGEAQEGQDVLAEPEGFRRPEQGDPDEDEEQHQARQVEHGAPVGRGHGEEVAREQLPQQADARDAAAHRMSRRPVSVNQTAW